MDDSCLAVLICLGVTPFQPLLVSIFSIGTFLVLLLCVVPRVLLTQLLFQIMVLLSEALHGRGESLNLSLEGSYVWFVSLNIIGGGRHRTSKNHATLGLGSVCYGLQVGIPQTAQIDDTEKITSELHGPRTLEVITCTTKRDNLTESTGVVLAKYPPKVKLELFLQL